MIYALRGPNLVTADVRDMLRMPTPEIVILSRFEPVVSTFHASPHKSFELQALRLDLSLFD